MASPPPSGSGGESRGSVSGETAGAAVAGATLIAVFGPLVGLSPAWIAVGLGGVLVALTVDASQWQGLGGHLIAEALPGGQNRLRRIAAHEAGHLLVARENDLKVRRVLVGTRACLQAGVRSNGATEFDLPDSVRMSLEDLRRWSRVLQAGIAAETLLYGAARGGLMTVRCWRVSGVCPAMTWRPPSASSVGRAGRSTSGCGLNVQRSNSCRTSCWLRRSSSRSPRRRSGGSTPDDDHRRRLPHGPCGRHAARSLPRSGRAALLH